MFIVNNCFPWGHKVLTILVYLSGSFFLQRFGLPLETLRIVLEGVYSELKLLNSSDKSLKELGFFRSNKVIPN